MVSASNNMSRNVLYTIGLFSVYVFFLIHGVEGANYSARCENYCNYANQFVHGYNCTSTKRPIYCCEQRGFRECCEEKILDIGHHAPVASQNACWRSWWIVHWRIMIGLLTALMLMLTLGAVCYCCCDDRGLRGRRSRVRGQVSPYRRRHLERGDRGDDLSISSRLRHYRDRGARPRDITTPEPHYDHSGTLVLTPPPYNTLPKDPPSYDAVFELRNSTPITTSDENDQSHTNRGFSDTNVDLPPPYSPSVSQNCDVRAQEPQSSIREHTNSVVHSQNANASRNNENGCTIPTGTNQNSSISVGRDSPNTAPPITVVQVRVNNS